MNYILVAHEIEFGRVCGCVGLFFRLPHNMLIDQHTKYKPIYTKLTINIHVAGCIEYIKKMTTQFNLIYIVEIQ